MILAIDIGNTNIVIGCIEDGDILFVERLSTNSTQTVLEYAISFKNVLEMYEISPSAITGSIIASVVPPVTNIVKDAVFKITHHKVLIVGPGLKTGLNILMDNPAQLGADLVVDAVAALAKYKPPLVIFDMGTATTLSVVDRRGSYLGGMIIPGLRLSVDALSARAAQLPYIHLGAPERLIGTNTVDCMQAGAVYSNAAMLDGLIDRVEEELGEPVTAVATGGLMGTVAPYCKRKIFYDENLMLEGLSLLYRKNVKKKA